MLVNRLCMYRLPEAVPLAQQKVLIESVLENMMFKRYREKWHALIQDESFLEGTMVSPPVEYRHHNEATNQLYNSLVTFSFPKSHKLLKGDVKIAYQRATFNEYFGEVVIPDADYKAIRLCKNENEMMVYWDKLLTGLFKEYFKQYGAYTFSSPARIHATSEVEDVSMVVRLPNYYRLMSYFECPIYGPSRTWGEFDIDIYIEGSYVLLPATINLKVKVHRDAATEDPTANP